MRIRRSPHSLQSLADEELMERAGGGDAEAFQIVLERHSAAAYALAYRILGRAGAAEDVLQEVLLTLWRSAARYDPARGSVRSWTLAIVHHRAIDALRRAAARPSVDARGDEILEGLAATHDTEEVVARRQESAALRSALALIPDEQRKVIELAFFGGFTHTEIATMTGLAVGTVKGRMRLGLSKLRDELSGKVGSL
jgi:RNA polymerase sigma-70 factor (ECF subfamily)